MAPDVSDDIDIEEATGNVTPLGRRETTVFSPKSKKQVVVKRSARLNQSN